jgi:hypothetical protein
MTILDNDGLPALDTQRYRDVTWRLSSVPDSDRLMLDRLADDRDAFMAHAIRTDPSPVRHLEFQRSQSLRSDEWRHQPVACETAQALGAAVRDALPREAVDDLTPMPGLDVRLKVVCTGPADGRTPWELMSGSHGAVVFDGIHVVRDVPIRYPAYSARFAPPLVVAIVVSGPSAKGTLDVATEVAAVAPRHARYRVERIRGQSTAAVKRWLLELRPHIVHFVGHGAKSAHEGFAILACEDDTPAWMNAKALADMLPSSVRLACLDTCISARNYDVRGLGQLAQAPSSLPTMIANQYAVTPDGAAGFWRGFYDRLAIDGDVVEAIYGGRCAARDAAKATADWGSYALYLRGASVLFESAPARIPHDAAREYAAQHELRLANRLAAASEALPPEAGEQLMEESRAAARDYVQLTSDIPEPEVHIDDLPHEVLR